MEFAPGKKGDVEKALKGNGAEFHYTFDDLNSYVVTMPASAINGLSKNPHVVDIEEDAKRYPMAVDATALGAALADEIIAGQQVVPWGVTAVQAPQAWATSTGAGIKLCTLHWLSENHNDLPDGMSGVSQVDNAWAKMALAMVLMLPVRSQQKTTTMVWSVLPTTLIFSSSKSLTTAVPGLPLLTWPLPPTPVWLTAQISSV